MVNTRFPCEPLQFDILLEILPPDLLPHILRHAGPVCRIACRAFRDAYGPLPTHLYPVPYPPTNPYLSTLSIPLLTSSIASFPAPHNITYINLSAVHKLIRNANITTIVKLCPNLRTLDLSHCFYLTETSIIALEALSHCLSSLNLTACSGLTPAAMRHLPPLTSLRTLTLPYSGMLSNTNAFQRITTLTQLESLQIPPDATDFMDSLLVTGIAELTNLHTLSLFDAHPPYRYDDVTALSRLTRMEIQVKSNSCRAWLLALVEIRTLRSLTLTSDKRLLPNSFIPLDMLTSLNSLEISAPDLPAMSVLALAPQAQLTSLVLRRLPLQSCEVQVLEDEEVDAAAELTAALQLQETYDQTMWRARIPTRKDTLVRLELHNLGSLPHEAGQKLQELAAVKQLCLVNTWVQDSAGMSLACLTGLTELSLKCDSSALKMGVCWRLQDVLRLWVAQLTGLTVLRLHCSDLTDGHLMQLSALSRLESMEVCGPNKVKGEGVRVVGGWINLQHLDLRGCNLLVDSSISEALMQHLPEKVQECLLPTHIAKGCVAALRGALHGVEFHPRRLPHWRAVPVGGRTWSDRVVM